jgi:hypothetical protein
MVIASSDIYIRDQHVVNTLGARVIALQNELMKVLWLRYAEVPFPSPSTTRPQTFQNGKQNILQHSC